VYHVHDFYVIFVTFWHKRDKYNKDKKYKTKKNKDRIEFNSEMQNKIIVFTLYLVNNR
jgi:hypothetical protein